MELGSRSKWDMTVLHPKIKGTTTLQVLCMGLAVETATNISECLLMNDDKTGFRFNHDRIKSAAYARIPEHLRQMLHLHIGHNLQAIVVPFTC